MLTAKKVDKLVKRPGRYPDGHGLYLQVINLHNASWQLRYQRNGRERWLGLGPLHTVSLKDARERAKAARLQLLDGVDPIDARRAARAKAASAITFAAAAERYYDSHEGKWRNAKHAAQFLSTLRTYASPILGKMPVAAVDTVAVLRVLEQHIEAERGYPAGPFWQSRPETASRVRGRIETVLDWATVRGHRTGDNPARWKGHLAEVLPERVTRVAHHAALNWRDVASFMVDLRGREGIAAHALEFTILTAARTGEAIAARWTEIDFSEATWTVPSERMKTRREPHWLDRLLAAALDPPLPPQKSPAPRNPQCRKRFADCDPRFIDSR